MTTPPPEQAPPLVAPTAEETAALNRATVDEELRALAQQLRKSGQLPFDPMTLVKGTVTAYDFGGSPPTVTINISGDSSTEITSVALLNNYSPQVGHTVLIAKQGADIVVLGHIADLGAYTVNGGAGGWVRADLSNGSHGGNGNGDIYYRRILDHGSWKMQWRGGWNVSGTFIIDTSKALGSDFRPSSKRSVLAARQVEDALSVQIDFHSDGRVQMVGANTTANSASVSGDVFSFSGSTGGVSIGGTTGGASAGTAHSHGWGGGSHGHGMGHDHGFSGGSHSHSVNTPTWLSFNGVEYFL
jgi:hypothetical protein